MWCVRGERGWSAGVAEDGQEVGQAHPKGYRADFTLQVASVPTRPVRKRATSPQDFRREGFPRPWSAKMTEGCVRLRLHKASSSLRIRDQRGSVGRDTHLLPRRKHLSHVRSCRVLWEHTLPGRLLALALS